MPPNVNQWQADGRGWAQTNEWHSLSSHTGHSFHHPASCVMSLGGRECQQLSVCQQKSRPSGSMKPYLTCSFGHPAARSGRASSPHVPHCSGLSVPVLRSRTPGTRHCPRTPPQCTPGSVRPCHEHTIFLSQRCTEPSRQRKKVREAGQYCAISSQKRAGPGNSFQGKGGGFQRPGHRPQVDGLCQGALVPSEADAVWGGERRGHRCRQPPLSLFCGLLRRRAATPAR